MGASSILDMQMELVYRRVVFNFSFVLLHNSAFRSCTEIISASVTRTAYSVHSISHTSVSKLCSQHLAQEFKDVKTEAQICQNKAHFLPQNRTRKCTSTFASSLTLMAGWKMASLLLRTDL